MTPGSGASAGRALRILVVGSLVNAIGNGLFAATSIVFLTRFVGLSTGQVGTGLTVAEVTGMCAALPFGALCDRWGPKTTVQLILASQAASMALYAFTSGFWSFLAAAALNAVFLKAFRATNNTLIAQGLEGGGPRARALARSASNLGVGVGSLLGVIALLLDTRPTFMLLLLADALSFVVVLVLFSFFPSPPGARGHRPRAGSRRPTRPSLSYLALTVLNGLMSLEYFVLTLGLPVWLVTRSFLPTWVLAAMLTLNTLMVAGLQVRLSQRIRGAASAGRCLRRAGMLFLASMSLFALDGLLRGPGVALAVLAAAVAIHSIAEIWHAAGAFEVSTSLAPGHAAGRHQATYNLGMSAAEAAAPTVIVACCTQLWPLGWILLGFLFATVGMLTQMITTRAGSSPAGSEAAPHAA